MIPATALLTGSSCRSSPAGAVAEAAAAEVSLIDPRPHWPCVLLPNANASPPSTATSECDFPPAAATAFLPLRRPPTTQGTLRCLRSPWIYFEREEKELKRSRDREEEEGKK